MLSFRLDCIPPKVSHHAKKIVRIGPYSKLADKPELAAARWDLITLLQPHRPAEPLDGALALSLVFVWPWNGGDSKKMRGAGWVWHPKKPDCDNIAKTFTDCLVRCAFITNDSRIVKLEIQKMRGNRPGIEVLLWQVDQGRAA